MNRKKASKPYWKMIAKELQEATKEFDNEFVADKAQPLTPEMQRRWERAKAKTPRASLVEDREALELLKSAIDQCLAMARKLDAVMLDKAIKALRQARNEIRDKESHIRGISAH